MESGGAVFDVMEVMGRAVGMDIAAASEAELAWADRAGDRLRGWIDAWQAQVQFEMTLPRPLPDLDGAGPPATGDDDDASNPLDPAAETAAAETAAGEESGDTEQRGPDSAGASTDEPLPSLGDRPAPAESSAERERKARRSLLLSALSAFAVALRAGRITTGHVDVLAAAIDRVPDVIRDRVLARGDELLASAVGTTPERFSRVVQRIIAGAYEAEGVDRAAAQRARSGLRRGVDDATKMHWLRVDLDPERGGLLFKQLDDEREAIFHGGHHKGLTRDQVELQALLNLLANRTAVQPSAAVQPTTTQPSPAAKPQRSSTKKLHGLVLIDVDTLLAGTHDRTVCETGAGVPLPPETVRRLLCLAEITYGLTINGRIAASVVNNDLATPEQRRELRMMYRTCCHPDCDRPFDDCQIHHIIARSRHGPTDVTLMVPLCSVHHDHIHHRGWTLTIDPDRTLTWTSPDGTQRVCPYVPLADLDQLRLFDDNAARPPPAA